MKTNLILEFDRRYRDYADKDAVINGENRMSFSILAQKAIIVGSFICEKFNSVKNLPIAIFLPKSEEAVIADLGVGYSCNIFMNLDIKLPESRLSNILNLIEPAIIITDNQFVSKLHNVNSPVFCIEDILNSKKYDENSHRFLIERLDQQIDTDPFCIINTSGSTGTPKGVVLNHRSFFDFYSWSVKTFNFNGTEIIGSLSPIVFDIFDFELCLLMLSGSTISLLDSNLAIFPARLLECVVKTKVNFIFWVPTIMVNIANMDILSKIDLSCLKTIWFAGEVFPTKQFNYWKRHLPNTTFANLYGPIEITLDCTYYIIDSEFGDDQPLPIGIPCYNTNVLILNEFDQLCKQGEVGELCVRGTSLAMGYYNNPEKTAAAFVQNPLNKSYPELIYRTGDLAYIDERGLIMFKGRKDSLIKHMGYRIELGEIEHISVNTLKVVPNCCVVYNRKAKAITMIYEKNENIDTLTVKKALMSQLPRYMVPTEFVELDQLPRNTNGKIDRLKLSNMINDEI